MWRRKHRSSAAVSPLGIVLGLAATGMIVFFVRNMLTDAIRYARIHRM